MSKFVNYEDEIILKTLLLKGEMGGIKSIEKTSSQGLVDTYTVTCDDGRVFTFDVTNGANGAYASLISLANVEGDTASQAYSVGEYLVYNEIFYKVVSPIEEGDAISPSFNVERALIGTELNLNKSELINGLEFLGKYTGWYGTSTTGSNTTDKVVTVDEDFTLVAGARVKVKFSETNTADAPTLNVNDTGAKTIAYKTRTAGSGTSVLISTPTVFWQNSEVVEFVYDGTFWRMSPTQSMIEDALTRNYPIGTIIHSTTCSTMAEVKALYGGTTWIQHTGYFLRGATSGVVADSATATGGEDTHTLTISEIPYHYHGLLSTGIPTTNYNVSEGGNVILVNKDDIHSAHTGGIGGGGSHNNIPTYKSVYIWERTV